MKAIEKIFNILEYFLEGDKEITLTDLAKETGLNISTVHVISSFLVERGYLSNDKHKRHKRYSLGTKFLDFADVVKRNIEVRDKALPHMENLRNMVNENVALAILDRDSAAILEMVESDHAFTLAGKRNVFIPLHNTGLGKILLAHMDKPRWEDYKKNNTLIAETPKTITDFSELEKHIASIKSEGVALDYEEAHPGVRSVAAPIKDRDNTVIASVGILGPKERMLDEKIDGFVMAVKGCALQISKSLGFKEV